MIKQKDRRKNATWESSKAARTFRKNNGIKREDENVDLRSLTRDPWASVEDDQDVELDTLWDEA